MKFVVLTEEQFNTFAQTHPLVSFHQSSYWAKVKAHNAWGYDFVGVEENGELIAATMILHKTMARVFKMYYAPKGFLMDYNNEELVSFFTKEMATFVKKNGGIFFKIDPYLDEVEMDVDGNKVEGGYDHSDVKARLTKNGYKFLTNKDGSMKTTMVHTIFALEFNGKTADELFGEFAHGVKLNIKKGNKYGVEVETLSYDQLPRFKAILEKTADRRGFVDRPLSYYQNIYNEFGDKMCYRMAKLNADVYLQKIEERVKKSQAAYDKLMARKAANPGTDYYDGKIAAENENLVSAKKQYDEIVELIKNYGHVVDLGCACYFYWGHEVVNLYGGNLEELMKYEGQYVLHWDMIQKACQEGFDRYNFYGISDNFTDENDPMYGVYKIKKGFNGHVIRFIGEYDYIINPFMYMMYNLAVAAYNKIR